MPGRPGQFSFPLSLDYPGGYKGKPFEAIVGDRRQAEPLDILIAREEQRAVKHTTRQEQLRLQETERILSSLARLSEDQRRALQQHAVNTWLDGLTMADVHRYAVERAIARCGGDKRKAAAGLGVALKTVYNWLHRFERHDRVAG